MARIDVAVTGVFIEPSLGTPASGVVTFTLPQPIISPLDGFTIEPVEEEFPLDKDGRISASLSTVSGVNAVYEAVIAVTGAKPRRFSFVVPHSAAPIDLATVQPVIPVLTDVPAEPGAGPFLQPANNLSDVSNVATARTNLGLGSAATQASSAFDAAGAAAAVQALSQPLDSDLTAIAALSTTSYGRALLALVDAAAARTALALGSAATASASSFDAAGAATAASAFSIQRANHTGTQASGTISDFLEAAQDAIGSALVGSATLDLTYDDGAGQIAGNVLDSPRIAGIAVSGTPNTGDTLSALSAGAAHWTPPPSAPVSSVNSRTGAVTGLAEASDLTAETTRAQAAEATALQKSANLSDLGSAATARTNLGLGSAATQASSAFDAAGAASAAQAASQPLDSDLTAIAALSTTSFGRALLTVLDAAAGRAAFGLGSAALASTSDFDPAGAAAGAQPLDSDLTAIAALSTTSFGRGLLTLADAASGRTALGLGTAATQNSSDFDAAGAASAAQAASQPLDGDLTAIASLSTASFGRSLLALADAAAGRTALGLGSASLAASTDFDAAGAAASAQAASQPVDSDLTAIAALATTSFGRSLLTMADAAAARGALALGSAALASTADFDPVGAAAAAQAASQPLDSDLTAIAALATTNYGRAFLALANAAAGRTALGLGSAATSATTDFDAAGAASTAQSAAQTYADGHLGSTVLTGTPAAGKVPMATSGSAAAWSALPAAPVSSVNSRTGAVTGLAEAADLATETAARSLADTIRVANTRTADYTFVASDAGKAVEGNSATALNFTVPPNSSVPCPVGTIIEVPQVGAGAVTLVAGDGVTITGDTVTPGQGGSLLLRKTGTDAWWVAIVSVRSGTYIDTTTAQVVAGAKRQTAVATFDNLIRVKGRRYADVTHPDFGADPTGGSPIGDSWKNAYDSLTAGGTLRIPGGDYLATGQVLLSGNKSVKVDTDGIGTKLTFVAASPLTDGLRIVDAGEFDFRGMRVRNAAGSADITNLVHYTTTGSSQMCSLRNLIIDPQASGVAVKLAIGADTASDVAEIGLDTVYLGGLTSSLAALRCGNGTFGNVSNIRAFNCYFGASLWGAYLTGANAQLYGCTAQANSGADIKLTACGAPVVVDGMRSEGSNRFFESNQNNGQLQPITLRNIKVDSFTDTNGYIVVLQSLAVLTVESFTARGGPVPARFLITSPGTGDANERAAVHASAILTESNTPFIPHANVDVDWRAPHRYIDANALVAVAP